MSISVFERIESWGFALFLAYACAFFPLIRLCDLESSRNSLKRFPIGPISIKANPYDFALCVSPFYVNGHTWILMWLEKRYKTHAFQSFRFYEYIYHSIATSSRSNKSPLKSIEAIEGHFVIHFTVVSQRDCAFVVFI